MRRVLSIFVLVVLGACADRTDAPYVSAPDVKASVEILTVTSRAVNEVGDFTGGRSETVRYFRNGVSIPPDHKPGKVELSYQNPDPAKHFVISEQTQLAGEAAFGQALRAALARKPKADREVVLFVHGYNNSYSDGLFRLAQLKNDLRVPGVMVQYSWPTAATPFGYSHDRDSVLYVRDDLQKTLELIRRSTDAPIVLVAHSMGGLLVMETLRQIEIGRPGWSKRALDGMVLIAPDISVDIFRRQTERFKSLPQPFAIFTSKKDPALRLSARLNGAHARLGNLDDPMLLSDIPVTLIDVTEFSGRSVDRHFVAGTSPALISLLTGTTDIESAFSADASGRTGLVPGTILTMQKATQLILSPGLVVEQ